MFNEHADTSWLAHLTKQQLADLIGYPGEDDCGTMRAGVSAVRNPDAYPDTWICHCGNTCDADGFYPCDTSGAEIEPDNTWGGLVVCARCRVIIAQDGVRAGHID